MKKILLLFVMSVLVVPSGVLAVFQSGDDLRVSAALQESYYGAGENVVIDAPIDGDVFVAGQTVRINAPITGDLFVFAQDVYVMAAVSGDIRGAAQSMTIESDVSGEVLFAAQDFSQREGVRIGRDLTAAGEHFSIDGVVNGDTTLASEGLDFGASAVVGGAIDLYGMTEGQVGGGGDFRSGITYHTHEKFAHQDRDEYKQVAMISVIGAFLMGLLMAILYPVLLVAGCRNYVTEWVSTSVKSFAIRAAIGFLALSSLPIFAIFITFTGIGAPLGFFLFLAWIILILLAIPTASVMLGAYAVGAFKHRKEEGGSGPRFPVTYVSAVVGGISMTLLLLVPVLGGIVSFALFLAALGGITSFLFGRLRRMWHK